MLEPLKPRRSRAERDALVLDNMGIVYLCVHRARRIGIVRRRLPFEDAVQFALLAACRAAELYDESRAYSFGAYLGQAIWNRLMQAVARDQVIQMPADAHCRKLTGPKVASLDAFEVEPLVRRPQLRPDGEAEQREIAALVRRSLRQLQPRERDVIRLRYGLRGGEPWTLDEVATVFGLSRERVRQIQNKALAKLRQAPELVGSAW